MDIVLAFVCQMVAAAAECSCECEEESDAEQEHVEEDWGGSEE